MFHNQLPYKNALLETIEKVDLASNLIIPGGHYLALEDALFIKYGGEDTVISLKRKLKSPKKWYQTKVKFALTPRLFSHPEVQCFGKDIYYHDKAIRICRDLAQNVDENTISEALVDQFSRALHFYVEDHKKQYKNRKLSKKRNSLLKVLKSINNTAEQFSDVMFRYYGEVLGSILLTNGQYWTEERRMIELETIRDHLNGNLEFDKDNMCHARVHMLEEPKLKSYLDMLASKVIRTDLKEFATNTKLSKKVIDNHLISTTFQNALSDLTDQQKDAVKTKLLTPMIQNIHMTYCHTCFEETAHQAPSYSEDHFNHTQDQSQEVKEILQKENNHQESFPFVIRDR